MATEQQRAEIREHLARVMTPELAEAFMESYPPHRWDDLATKADLALLRDDLDERFVLRQEAMEHRLLAEMRRLSVDQTRLLFFAMIGAIFTTATLAFAAVRL